MGQTRHYRNPPPATTNTHHYQAPHHCHHLLWWVAAMVGVNGGCQFTAPVGGSCGHTRHYRNSPPAVSNTWWWGGGRKFMAKRLQTWVFSSHICLMSGTNFCQQKCSGAVWRLFLCHYISIATEYLQNLFFILFQLWVAHAKPYNLFRVFHQLFHFHLAEKNFSTSGTNWGGILEKIFFYCF